MKKEEWIKGEIAKWRSEGVVDGTTADVLLERYRAAESRVGWGAIIAGSFGALLIGLGVIAIFAANWDYLGRAERAMVAIVPLHISFIFDCLMNCSIEFLNIDIIPYSRRICHYSICRTRKHFKP